MHQTNQTRLKNLLSTAKASVGTRMFRKYYLVNDKGKEIDILHNEREGSIACGKHVSSVLYLNKLIGDVHATVASTVKDMEESGWVKTGEMKPGCILHWPEDYAKHTHIGFYIDENTVISNSDQSGVPEEHGVERKGMMPDAIYIHPDIQV